MNYVGRLLSNFKGFYNEINSATLTGAIDVIIVKQEDGTYLSSPFHVRFGKMGVLQPREKVVDIEINGEPVDLHMKLGEAGEAFFVQEEDSYDVPEHLATSPIPSALDLMEMGIQDLRHRASIQEQLEEMAAQQVVAEATASVLTSIAVTEPESVGAGIAQVDSAMSELSITMSRSRSVTPTPSVETGVGTQTGTPPMSPKMTKDSSSNSISSSNLPKKDSQTSLYHSVHTSFDKGSDEEDKKKGSDEEERRKKSSSEDLRRSPSRKKQSSGSEDEHKSDMATQTDMTGDIVATIAKSSPAVSVRVTSSDESVISSPISTSSMPCLKVQAATDSSSSASATALSKSESSAKLSASPGTSRTKISSTKKKRRKKIERKRREMHLKDSLISSLDEASNEGDNSSVDGGQPAGENLLFDMDLSAEDSLDELSMSRTVSMPIIDDSRRRDLVGEWASSQHASAFHPFSDGDITPVMSPIGSRPPSPKSDTEFETHQQFDAVSQTLLTGDDFETIDEIKWKWGELPESTPRSGKSENSAAEARKGSMDDMKSSGGLFNFMRKTKKVRHQPEQEGIYLDDLNLEEMDPEVAALYLYHPKGPGGNQLLTIKDEDNESGRGGSLPQSPVSHEHQRHDSGHSSGVGPSGPAGLEGITMSLCGGLKETVGDGPPEKFTQYQVTYEQFSENTSIINNPNLVIRVGGKYYNWQIAGPMIMSALAFQRPLPQDTIETLIKQHMPKKDRRRSWIWWRTTNTSSANEPVVVKGAVENPEPVPVLACEPPSDSTSPKQGTDGTDQELKELPSGLSDSEDWMPKPGMSDGEIETELVDQKIYTYRKSLKLTSEQIEKLNLQDGVNDVSFSVTTMYQGTSRCVASIYLWNWDDRIIISDIDGTITKSDVLGQLLPMVGKDWSQAGIANLYNEIHRNGYKFLYLSARAIGQSKLTRDYLRSIQQGKVSLPDGPLLLSPSSLISAFHREVIERKPEEFKISCLRDIAALFPTTKNPFYSGFGNKINDVWAYRAVGIPMTRIFTVNHKGELKMELSQTFQSTYTKLSDIADHFFPPLVHKDATDGATSKVHAGNFPASEEFSTFTYWREPLVDIDADLQDFNQREEPKR